MPPRDVKITIRTTADEAFWLNAMEVANIPGDPLQLWLNISLNCKHLFDRLKETVIKELISNEDPRRQDIMQDPPESWARHPKALAEFMLRKIRAWDTDPELETQDAKVTLLVALVVKMDEFWQIQWPDIPNLESLACPMDDPATNQAMREHFDRLNKAAKKEEEKSDKEQEKSDDKEA